MSANGVPAQPTGIRLLSGGPCLACRHARSDHIGPDGCCRFGYEPIAPEAGEQCLCRRYRAQEKA